MYPNESNFLATTCDFPQWYPPQYVIILVVLSAGNLPTSPSTLVSGIPTELGIVEPKYFLYGLASMITAEFFLYAAATTGVPTST